MFIHTHIFCYSGLCWRFGHFSAVDPYKSISLTLTTKIIKHCLNPQPSWYMSTQCPLMFCNIYVSARLRLASLTNNISWYPCRQPGSVLTAERPPCFLAMCWQHEVRGQTQWDHSCPQGSKKEHRQGRFRSNGAILVWPLRLILTLSDREGSRFKIGNHVRVH